MRKWYARQRKSAATKVRPSACQLVSLAAAHMLLDGVPPELLREILALCDATTLVRLRRSCKSWAHDCVIEVCAATRFSRFLPTLKRWRPVNHSWIRWLRSYEVAYVVCAKRPRPWCGASAFESSEVAVKVLGGHFGDARVELFGSADGLKVGVNDCWEFFALVLVILIVRHGHDGPVSVSTGPGESIGVLPVTNATCGLLTKLAVGYTDVLMACAAVSSLCWLYTKFPAEGYRSTRSTVLTSIVNVMSAVQGANRSEQRHRLVVSVLVSEGGASLAMALLQRRLVSRPDGADHCLLVLLDALVRTSEARRRLGAVAGEGESHSQAGIEMLLRLMEESGGTPLPLACRPLAASVLAELAHEGRDALIAASSHLSGGVLGRLLRLHRAESACQRSLAATIARICTVDTVAILIRCANHTADGDASLAARCASKCPWVRGVTGSARLLALACSVTYGADGKGMRPLETVSRPPTSGYARTPQPKSPWMHGGGVRALVVGTASAGWGVDSGCFHLDLPLLTDALGRLYLGSTTRERALRYTKMAFESGLDVSLHTRSLCRALVDSMQAEHFRSVTERETEGEDTRVVLLNTLCELASSVPNAQLVLSWLDGLKQGGSWSKLASCYATRVGALHLLCLSIGTLREAHDVCPSDFACGRCLQCTVCSCAPTRLGFCKDCGEAVTPDRCYVNRSLKASFGRYQLLCPDCEWGYAYDDEDGTSEIRSALQQSAWDALAGDLDPSCLPSFDASAHRTELLERLRADEHLFCSDEIMGTMNNLKLAVDRYGFPASRLWLEEDEASPLCNGCSVSLAERLLILRSIVNVALPGTLAQILDHGSGLVSLLTRTLEHACNEADAYRHPPALGVDMGMHRRNVERCLLIMRRALMVLVDVIHRPEAQWYLYSDPCTSPALLCVLQDVLALKTSHNFDGEVLAAWKGNSRLSLISNAACQVIAALTETRRMANTLARWLQTAAEPVKSAQFSASPVPATPTAGATPVHPRRPEDASSRGHKRKVADALGDILGSDRGHGVGMDESLSKAVRVVLHAHPSPRTVRTDDLCRVLQRTAQERGIEVHLSPGDYYNTGFRKIIKDALEGAR